MTLDHCFARSYTFLCHQDYCSGIYIIFAFTFPVIWELLVAVGCPGPGPKGEEKQIIIEIGEIILQ